MRSGWGIHSPARQRREKRRRPSGIGCSGGGAETLSLTLALGRPGIYPEQWLSVEGFKPAICNERWPVAKVVRRGCR